FVIQPAVVIAAQSARLDIAIAEVGAAMPAMPVDEAPTPAEILVEHEVFAQEPHRLGARPVELGGAGDRQPIAAQEIAHRRPGAVCVSNSQRLRGSCVTEDLRLSWCWLSWFWLHVERVLALPFAQMEHIVGPMRHP